MTASDAGSSGDEASPAPPQDLKPPATPASNRRVFFSVSFFCLSSLGAIFINKACLTHYRFSYPFFLMLLQCTFTLAGACALAYINPASFAPTPIKRADRSRLALPTLLFVCNVSVGLSALSLVNIPMFSAFRRITVLFVMLAEYIVLRKSHSRRVIASVFVLALGAFVSALGDVTFSLLGYALVFANNIFTAMYLASIKQVMADISITPYSLLFYMSLLSFFPVLALSMASGDLSGAIRAYQERPELHSTPFFAPALLFVAASALCVNLSTSMCCNATSPLTTSVAGQLKNVLQTVLGFFSWGYIPTPLNVFGLVVALGGQIAFGLFKYAEGEKATAVGESAAARGDGYERLPAPSTALGAHNISSSNSKLLLRGNAAE